MFVVRTYNKLYQLQAEFQNASAIQGGFGVSKSGQLTFQIPMSDPKCTSSNLAFNNIVTVESDELEPWDGNIVDQEEDGNFLTITANSIVQRLGSRRTDNITFTNKTAGEVATAILAEANHIVSTGIGVGTIFDGGPHYTLTYNFDNTYTRLTELAGTSLYEFRVRREGGVLGTWVLDFVEKLGADKTASVLLIYGEDIDGAASYKKDNTLWANYITAFGKSPSSASAGTSLNDTRPHVTYADWVAIADDGLSQDTIENPNTSSTDTLLRLAKQAVDKRRRPLRTLAITLNRKRGNWANFSDGDIIQVQLPSYDFTGIAVPFRVLARDVSYDLGSMAITGEVMDGEEALLLDMYTKTIYGSD